MCAACVYTRRAAPDWTAYYRENQFHQAFIAEHDLGAWRWHEHRGRRRFGSTARARSTGGSRILLPWVCGVEERDTPRQRASVRALASLLAREGAPLAGADAAQPAAGRGRPGAPLRRGAVHLLREEEVPQGAGFFTAARAQDIRRAAVAAVAALETATAKAVAPPPPLVGDAVTEPASVGHYPAAVAAVETAVCVAACNTALKALMVIVASSPGAQQQLVDSGGLALLARLAGDGAAAEPKSAAADTQRHVLRIVAVLSANPRTFTALLHGSQLQGSPVGARDWRPWIVRCGKNATDRKTRAYAPHALSVSQSLSLVLPPPLSVSHQSLTASPTASPWLLSLPHSVSAHSLSLSQSPTASESQSPSHQVPHSVPHRLSLTPFSSVTHCVSHRLSVAPLTPPLCLVTLPLALSLSSPTPLRLTPPPVSPPTLSRRRYASRALFNLDALTAAHAPAAPGGGSRSHDAPHLLHDGIHPITTHPACDAHATHPTSGTAQHSSAVGWWPQWLPQVPRRGRVSHHLPCAVRAWHINPPSRAAASNTGATQVGVSGRICLPPVVRTGWGAGGQRG